MATVKKANVPATHPTVYAGLALAVVGLLVAAYAYTGTRIYNVVYAAIALVGGLLAFVGILTAAWGRSIMAARAARSKRGLDSGQRAATESLASEQPPTVAAPAEKKRFSFPMPKRRPKEPEAAPGAVFAFKRRAAEPVAAAAEPANTPEPSAPLVTLAPPASPELERVTLKCPQCATQFTTEGTRPMLATCPSCGFSATI